jgi:hypothetical protein
VALAPWHVSKLDTWPWSRSYGTFNHEADAHVALYKDEQKTRTQKGPSECPARIHWPLPEEPPRQQIKGKHMCARCKWGYKRGTAQAGLEKEGLTGVCFPSFCVCSCVWEDPAPAALVCLL